MVDKDAYLLHLSRYIHLNPRDIDGVKVHEWPYSSYGDYLRQRHTPWIHKDFILSLFASDLNRSPSDMGSYQSFVEEALPQNGRTHGMDGLEYLCLDDEPHAGPRPVQGEALLELSTSDAY